MRTSDPTGLPIQTINCAVGGCPNLLDWCAYERGQRYCAEHALRFTPLVR